MAPHLHTVLLLLLLLLFSSSIFVSSLSHNIAHIQLPQFPKTQIYLGRRTLLGKQDDNDDERDAQPVKKKLSVPGKDHDHDAAIDSSALPKKIKKASSDKDEQVLLSKKKTKKLEDDAKLSKGSTKNQTKLIKPIAGLASSKNKTKLIKSTNNNSTSKSNPPNLAKIKLKILNSTSNKPPPKPNSKSTTTEKKQKAPPSPVTWSYESDTDGFSDDLVSEFRQLPTKFQQTFLPDLHRISTSSQNYISKANKEMTKNIKPYVGTLIAPSLTIAISIGVILLPLLIVSLIFTKVKPYFSLQRLIILTQIYLSIYFSTLCISSLLTGLEPLKFFYATSQGTYVWVQVFQTLGYVIYLSMMLMYLILVFYTKTSLGQKGLGLAQTIVGFAVGLHYYVTVFHRVVLRQPPRTNWKVHGVYATCFLVICLFARAERRKKVYVVEGSEEGKTS